MLNGNEIGTDERNVVLLLEDAYHSGVVNSGNKNGKEIGQESGLLLKIESKRLESK